MDIKVKLDPYFITTFENKCQMDQGSKYKHETTQVLFEKNEWISLWPEHRGKFSNYNSKSNGMKEKIDNIDYIKTHTQHTKKTFCIEN